MTRKNCHLPVPALEDGSMEVWIPKQTSDTQDSNSEKEGILLRSSRLTQKINLNLQQTGILGTSNLTQKYITLKPCRS